MLPIALSTDAFARGRSRSERGWTRREVLTGIALILLTLDVAFYVVVLLRLLLFGR